MNLAIFRTQLFTKRIITAFLTFIVSYFFMILAPLYLQLALNYSVQFSGILLMAGSTNSLMREFGLVLGTTISTALFYQIMSLMSHKEVHTASGASKRVLLISQSWTYGVAFLILLLAIFYLKVMIRKAGTQEER